MTKQLDILSANETKTTVTSSVENKTTKESPSLFDSLMANAKTKAENKEASVEKSKAKTDSKSSEEKVINTDNTKTSNESKKNTSIKTNENTKTDNSEVSKENKTDKSKNTEELKTTKDVENKNKQNTEVKNEEPKKNDTTEVSNKSSGSLLDRLVLEAKNTIKTTSQEDFESKVNSKNKKNKEVLDTKQNSVNPDISKEVKKDNKATENISADKKETKTDTKDIQNKDKQEEKDSLKDIKNEVKKDSTSNLERKIEKENTSSNNDDSKVEDKKVNKNTSSTIKIDNQITNSHTDNPQVNSDLSKEESKNNTFISSTEKKEETSSKKISTATSSNIKANKDLTDNNAIDSTNKIIKNEALKENVKDNLKTSNNEKNSDIEKNNSSKAEVPTDLKENKKTSLIDIVDNKEAKHEKIVKTEELIVNTKDEKDTKNITSTKVEDKNTDKKINSQKVEQNIVSSSITKTEVKNEKVANELASISKENKNETLNVSKEELNTSNTSVKKEENKSLMDKLIEKNQNEIKKQTLDKEEKGIDSKSLESILPESKKTKTNNSSDFISNMYLSSQKNTINKQSLANKKEAQETLKEGKSTASVEKSAKILDLGLEKVNVEVKTNEIKKDEINHLDKKSSLDRLAFNKNVRTEENNTLITKSIEASKVVLEDNTIKTTNEVSVNVNHPLSQNIQSKIIGARQSMSTMMSDVAKQMYENYKPPVTAFKINLNPGTLGGIAIVLKSDKDNAISISMNISNSSTLDAFVENQNSLKSALNKTFDEDTQFNLDFSSNDNNEQSSNNKDDENGDKSFGQNKGNTQAILNARENNQEVEDKNLDYM